MKLWPLALFVGLCYWTELQQKQPQTTWLFSHDFRGDERQTTHPSEWTYWKHYNTEWVKLDKDAYE